jgi:membrane-associated phospholipid phosphatase
MLAVYAAWGGLYLLTAWIGELRGPAFDAALGIDRGIPYLPAFQYAYALCYVMPFGLFLIDTRPAFLDRAYAAFIAANAVAFVFFAAIPVQGPMRDSVTHTLGVDNFFLMLVYSVDSRYNALPSLHVTNPWLVAFLCLEHRGWSVKSAVLLFIALLISIATLFVRQHYFLDVLAGFALAGATMLVFKKTWRPEQQ